MKFLSFMWNPLSWVMEAAALMEIVLANGGVSRELSLFTTLPPTVTFDFVLLIFYPYSETYFQGEGPDWQDFVGILCLLVINSTISFIEENNAGNAAASLMAHLAPKTKVCFFVDGVDLRNSLPMLYRVN